MEYIFTNLPQYIKVTPRSAFANSVVQSGAVLLFSEDGTSLTAKLPDGSFITVGGSGTDVSSTTAEAADVLSGKVFYNSAGTLTSGGIQIQSGQTITPTTSNQIISSGVYLGGSQTILGDASLVASNIVSGASIFGVSGTYAGSSGAEVTLGYITSGGQFQPLTFSGTSAADSGSPVTLSCYSWNLPTFTSGVIVSSGMSLYVSAPDNYISTTVESGGSMVVLSGGTATDTIINNAGYLIISSGGTAIGGTASGGGIMFAWEGASASGFNLPAGYMRVKLSPETYISGTMRGSSVVMSGGTLTDMTFPEGLTVDMESGTYAENLNLTSNTQIDIKSGASAYSIYATGSNGRINIGPGGSANTIGVAADAILSFNGINGGGTAAYVDIGSAGSGVISKGGMLTTGTISSGGTLWVRGSGTATDITVESGGTMTIYSGAVTSNITSETGAIIINS